MADPLGPARNTVGIRQVRSDGTKLATAMALDVIGGDITTVEADDGVMTYRLDLSGNASNTDLDQLNERVQTLEAGGRWTVALPFVGATAPEDVALDLGRFHRLDLSAYGSGDTCTCTLPLATAEDVGRRIAVSVISSGTIGGGGNAEVEITTTSAQEIDGRTLPIALAGVRPRIVFVAVVNETDVAWGWSVESWTKDP